VTTQLSPTPHWASEERTCLSAWLALMMARIICFRGAGLTGIGWLTASLEFSLLVWTPSNPPQWNMLILLTVSSLPDILFLKFPGFHPSLQPSPPVATIVTTLVVLAHVAKNRGESCSVSGIDNSLSEDKY